MMNGLQRAHFDERSIRVEKFSPITDTGCVCEEVLRLLGKPINRWQSDFVTEPIGNNVWRAKVGKRGEWGYGRSIDEALDAAFKAVHNVELSGSPNDKLETER